MEKNGTHSICKSHAQIPGTARILDIGLNVHLLPILTCATSEASDEPSSLSLHWFNIR